MANPSATGKLPARQKYCFGIGAIGKDAICNLVGAFLMLYFTDTLGLNPAFVGVLFAVARIWDAVNDPMMGMICDNTRTRFGKFRIWLIIGTLVNSVFFILLFTTLGIEKGSPTMYIYVSVMYVLYGMTYTIMDVPYWSWLPNLSSNPEERESISVIPRIFASLGGFIVCTFGLRAINFFNNKFGDNTVMQKAGKRFLRQHLGNRLHRRCRLHRRYFHRLHRHHRIQRQGKADHRRSCYQDQSQGSIRHHHQERPAGCVHRSAADLQSGNAAAQGILCLLLQGSLSGC